MWFLSKEAKRRRWIRKVTAENPGLGLKAGAVAFQAMNAAREAGVHEFDLVDIGRDAADAVLRSVEPQTAKKTEKGRKVGRNKLSA